MARVGLLPFCHGRGFVHADIEAHVACGAFESYDDAINEALARQSAFEWPHAFAWLEVEWAGLGKVRLDAAR